MVCQSIKYVRYFTGIQQLSCWSCLEKNKGIPKVLRINLLHNDESYPKNELHDTNEIVLKQNPSISF